MASSTGQPEPPQHLGRRRLRRALAAITGIGLIAGVPLLTPTLNALKIMGTPLGYVVVAHGIAIVCLLWAATSMWISRHEQ